MKSTSPGRVAQITHATGLAENFCPWHFVQMVFERHRVCDKLEAFIQTAVRLDVEIFCVFVRDVEQLLCVAVYRAALINFELNTEMPQALAVEHEIGRVAVLVDDFAVLIPAGLAVGVVVTVPLCAVAMNNAVAVLAADAILIKAMLTQSVRIVLDSVFLVDPLSTVIADYGQAICAVLAEPIAFYLVHIFD